MLRYMMIGIALLALAGCGITDGDSRGGGGYAPLMAAEIPIDGRYEVGSENPGILKVDGASWSATLAASLGHFEIGGTVTALSKEEIVREEVIGTQEFHYHRKSISLNLILKTAKQVYPDGEEVVLTPTGIGPSLVFSKTTIKGDTVYSGRMSASYQRDLRNENDTGQVSYTFRGRSVKRI